MRNLINYNIYLLTVIILLLAHAGLLAQSSHLTLEQKADKIFVTDGINEKVVAPSLNNLQPLIAVGNVFYIHSTVNKTTLKAYSIANNTTTDILKANELNSGTPTDKKIINMVFDKMSGRLYFSTLSVNANGYENYLTWYYDPATAAIKLFADGKVTSVDKAGAVQSEMHGTDANGAYSQMHINTNEGASGVLGPRTYTIKTTGAANN
jgi:hypothetical protein